MNRTTTVPAELNHPTAEVTVLAALVGHMDLAIELAPLIDPADFSTPLGQVVAEAALRILRGVEPLDVPNILAACRDVARERRLTGVAITESVLNGMLQHDVSRAGAYAVTVKRYAWLRKAREFADWFRGEVDSIGDPDELFTAAQEQIQHLQPATRSSAFVYGWDTVKEHDRMLRERVRDFEAGAGVIFDWPWSSWNRFVRPLRPGLVGIVAAPDGVGKSSVLEMVAEHWAAKANVVLVHCENDFDYTMNRRLCRWSKVSIANIEDGNLSAQQLERIREAYRLMERFSPSLHYLDASGWTASELAAELTIRHSEGVCDAVVLDYINKLRPSREQMRLYGNNEIGRQADDMEQLKTWAVRHSAPLLTAAQFTKEGKKLRGRKTRSGIRGTGEWSDKVQLVILMDREILETPMLDPRGEIIADAGEYGPEVAVRVDKQNRGRTGEFKQFYLGKYFELRDVQA